MVIPFICNLFRRHPACKVLVHRPNGPEGKGRVGRGVLHYAFRQHKEQYSCGGGGEIPAPIPSSRRILLSLEFAESQQTASAGSLAVKTYLRCSSLTLGLTVGSLPLWFPGAGCFERGTLPQATSKC